MKVALVYSGQPRNLKDCYANHVHHLMRNNPDCDFDVFGHMWIDPDKHFWDKHPNRGSWSDDDTMLMWRKWKPKRIVFETPKVFESNLTPEASIPHPIQNTLSMLYSIEQANNARNEYEKQEGVVYDCVIRLRTDLYFGDNANINLSTIDLKKMNVVERASHRSYGCNDQFAISNPVNMNAYSRTYSLVNELVESGCVINPECLVGYNSFVKHSMECVSHERGPGDRWQFTLYRDRYAPYHSGTFSKDYTA